MPSTIHPIVPVELDKPRHLCYGAAAFIEFKEKTGKDLLHYVRDLAGKFASAGPVLDEKTGAMLPNENYEVPYKEFRDILWAGLIHEDPDLDPRDVSNMFSLANIMDLMPLVMEAFTLAMPKQQAANGNGHPRKAPVKGKLTGA
jgi:hypothetical protein